MSAVLVEDRILRRVIKRHRRLRGVGLQVPHADCYTLPRADLAKLVDQSELHVDIANLPERVIAFRGSREQLAAESPAAAARAWRAIFHARVHEAYEELLAQGQLTPAAIRERVARIGQTEFDEIRYVLRHADLLLPPDSDTTTYIEFVALYLELAYFAPDALGKTFPTLSGGDAVRDTIALDIDPDALVAASRPPGAPERPVAASTPSEPSAELAAAVARDGTAHAAAEEMAGRLAATLGLPAADPAWTAALLPLAATASAQRRERFTASARLWHDLRAACQVVEREVRVVDVIGWALSFGRHPVTRALPATREVRIAKHLHAAAHKLAGSELPPHEREQLAAVLEEITERAEDNVRAALRPKLEDALAAVELRPRNLPERVAQKKLIDELLDEAVAVGRITLGNLRDALSHSQLKMDDLRASELVRGDALLRCDRLLSVTLDGVYRGGEAYLRWLQKISSVLFGTGLGRLLSLYVMLPVLGAFTAVEGAQHVVGPLSKLATGEEPEIATTGAFVTVGVFLFLLLHAPPFRRFVVLLLRLVGRALRLLLFECPRAIWNLPLVRRFRESRFARVVVAPAIPAVIVAPMIGGRVGWPVAGIVFVVAEIVVNSRVGRLAEEIVADWIVRSGRRLARRIVPGLVRWILWLFTELIELLDRGIYRVDEWLRFRTGESRVTLVIKGAVSPVWRFLTYFLRLYVNLFLEPVVNPIKHFPVVTVAAKLMLPFSPTLLRAIAHALRAALGRTLAGSVAAFTVFVIPGLAGFLVWEFKENWKLYRATRPTNLREVAIGHHGESMVGLMKPGFHSGTIPKLYTKLRRAAWKGDERAVARHRNALHHVSEAVERFADRELVSLLVESKQFHANDLAVAGVTIASNRVQIALACPTLGDAPVAIAFEEQSGWLLASIRERGWLPQLPDDEKLVLENALAGFYKLAGVDLVREQLEQVLGDAPYDVSREGLVVWPGEGYATEVVYDLHAREPRPEVRGPELPSPPPTIAHQGARFGQEAIRWMTWVTAWEAPPPPRIAVGPRLVRDA